MDNVMDNVPIYNLDMLLFDTPKGLRDILEENPLDEDFIDWVVENGYRIFYQTKWPRCIGKGRVNYDMRAILIGIDPNEKVDDPFRELQITKAHELIHVAIPDSRLTTELVNYMGDKKKFVADCEEVIEDFARRYSLDNDFMYYLNSVVPVRFGGVSYMDCLQQIRLF